MEKPEGEREKERKKERERERGKGNSKLDDVIKKSLSPVTSFWGERKLDSIACVTLHLKGGNKDVEGKGSL